jgi:hypothetical protein
MSFFTKRLSSGYYCILYSEVSGSEAKSRRISRNPSVHYVGFEVLTAVVRMWTGLQVPGRKAGKQETKAQQVHTQNKPQHSVTWLTVGRSVCLGVFVTVWQLRSCPGGAGMTHASGHLDIHTQGNRHININNNNSNSVEDSSFLTRAGF